MVITTPLTVMPLPTCDKKLAIAERLYNAKSGNHKKSIYSQAITGPCCRWLVPHDKNVARFVASHEYSLFAWLMNIAVNYAARE